MYLHEDRAGKRAQSQDEPTAPEKRAVGSQPRVRRTINITEYEDIIIEAPGCKKDGSSPFANSTPFASPASLTPPTALPSFKGTSPYNPLAWKEAAATAQQANKDMQARLTRKSKAHAQSEDKIKSKEDDASDRKMKEMEERIKQLKGMVEGMKLARERRQNFANESEDEEDDGGEEDEDDLVKEEEFEDE